jgi:Sec-independent protein translocase protein TatA
MILELIQAIIDFIKRMRSIFKDNKQQQSNKNQEELNKIKDDLKEKYNKVDKNKENESKQNLKDRLNNMF